MLFTSLSITGITGVGFQQSTFSIVETDRSLHSFQGEEISVFTDSVFGSACGMTSCSDFHIHISLP